MASIVEQRRAITSARRPLVVAEAQAATRAGRSFTPHGIARTLGTPTSNITRIVRELEAQGLVRRLAFSEGYVWAGEPAADVLPSQSPRSTRARHLGDLLALARSNTHATATARRGRQADDVSRDVQMLTPAQLGDVERLAALILRHTPAAGGDPARVDLARFVWDATAGQGRGEWALQADVTRWAQFEHRAKHERAGRGAWRPMLAKATVSNYRGAVNNLCFLAATHDAISRSPRNSGGAPTLYDPAWTPSLERWFRWVLRAAAKARGTDTYSDGTRIRRGLRTLAVAATRRGGLSRRTTDWPAVRAAIEDEHQAGAFSHADYRAARSVWRLVVAALDERVNWPDAARWSLASDDPMSLVPSFAIDTAARIDIGLAERDFTGWTMRDGRYPEGLIESADGLRAWAAWSTLPDAQLRRAGLPPRAWDQAPSIGRRRRPAPIPVTRATMLTRLSLLARLAGFAARDRGIDWSTADLRALCDPALVDAYLAAAESRPRYRKQDDGAATRRQLVMTVAWLVNGFLCARATADLAKAERTGGESTPSGARLEELRGWYRQLEQLAAEIPAPRSMNLEEVAKHVIAVAEAWRGTDQVEGILKIGRLRDLLIQEACDAVGGLSLEEQIAALEAGLLMRNARWARALRLAVVLTIALRIPLRGVTFTLLTLDMWRNAAVGTEQCCHPLALWEGAIRLEIPGALMKSGRDFQPSLILAKHVRTSEQAGSDAREAALCRPLLQLWFAAGGAREFCCTVAPAAASGGNTTPVVRELPWLFPDLLDEERAAERPDARRRATARRRPRPDARSGYWERPRLSAAFREAVSRHAPSLGLELSRLRGLRGARGFHTIRRLFGTFWAPRNLVHTSRLLDHRNVAITAAIYTASDERVISLDASAEYASAAATAEAAWRKERDELQSLIAALTAQLKGSGAQTSGGASYVHAQ